MNIKALILSAAISALAAGGAFAKNPFLSEDYWTEVTVEQVKADMAAGNSLLDKNKIGRQALHYALRGGASHEVLRFLLEQKVPIRPEGNGVWAELYAARYGDLETLKLFADFGADFKSVDYMSEGAVYWMAKGKVLDLDKLAYFEGLGLDLNLQNRLGMTPAIRAAMNKKGGELLDALLERGATIDGIDSEGRDVFMRALTKNDNAEMLERFYAMSEDPEAEDNYGYSGVLIAASDEEISEDRLAFLEAKGFDLEATDAKGRTAFHMIAGNVEEEAVEGFEAMLAHGLEVTAVDDAGNTVLHHALKAKGEAELLWLIDHGADVKAANAKGVTPLMLALGRGEDMAAVIDRMLADGADLMAQDAGGATSLIQAVKGNQPLARIEQILAAGVDVNAVDGEGTTALMYAALQAEDPAVIEALVTAGADRAAKDVFDDTASQMAADNAALKDSPALALLQ
jgi:ankyrin repeat protein